MNLVVNIGNTNIRFGIFKSDYCEKSWIINTKPFKTSDEMFINFNSMYHHYGIKSTDIHKIIVGSVVPQLTENVCDALEKLHGIKPIIVNRDTISNVKHESNQIGTDLYANAVSAHYLYSGKKIIIDFGTALTFVALDEYGTLLGVVIAPGIQTSLNALIGNTAQLSNIEFKKPNIILGKNTEHCMQSGIIYGFESMVEGMIKKINKEINSENTCVIATGGLSHIFSSLIPRINHCDQLHTLKGLYILGNK